MKAYRYTTPEADFLIYPDNGFWGLIVNGSRRGEYASPDDAVADVAAQNTGDTGWDLMEDVDAPELLQNWLEVEIDPGDLPG